MKTDLEILIKASSLSPEMIQERYKWVLIAMKNLRIKMQRPITLAITEATQWERTATEADKAKMTYEELRKKAVQDIKAKHFPILKPFE